MMLNDAPRYVRKKEEKSADDEAAEITGFFQSQLK